MTSAMRWIAGAALLCVGCGAAGSTSAGSASASSSTSTTSTSTSGSTSGSTTGATTGTGTPSADTVPSASQLNVVLGRPTGSSIAASVMTTAGTQVYLEYGTVAGVYTGTSLTQTATSAAPVVVELSGLAANTRYYYRARYRSSTDVTFQAEPERSFITARAAGATFSFGVQGDSHPERANNMFNAGLYALNMQNVASRRPDFYLALGDDFSVENILTANTLSASTVDALYANQRTYFGLLGHSTPVFLVNGNHEQAAQYLLNGKFVTPYGNAPILQGKARTTYFALPATDGFYSADTTQVSGVGLLRDYYAWEWGDALFVAIDPYWHSPVPVDNGVPGVDKTADTWQATIGDEQYAWLKKTLETSRAKYKFVFAHHVQGTFRGAAAIVHSFEWGGYNKNGTAYEFPSMRPGWAKPIHQLLNDTGVTVFFAGHDHLFGREKVDNVIYQEVPNPADNTYTAFNIDAYNPAKISLPGAKYDPAYGVALPNAGHLIVTVSASQVTIAYIRAVLPGDESKAGATNNAVAFSYTIPAPGSAAAAIKRP